MVEPGPAPAGASAGRDVSDSAERRPGVAPPDARARRERARRARTALALRRWCAGQAAVERLTAPAERAAYEWAIGLVLRHLPPDGTFAELLRADGERRGPFDACLRAACLCGAPDGRLVAPWVRAAAFWRRLHQRLREPDL